MKKLIIALTVVLIAGCHSDICWPDSIPVEERYPCPSSHPYRNPWHPNFCYDTPQTPTPPYPGK